jgi:hypothetical protein
MAKKLAKPPWVRYYPADFSTGVALLGALEELAYRRICEQIYITGAGLPDNDVVMASYTKTEEAWLDVKQALIRAGKIEITEGGFIINQRSVSEYHRAEKVYNQRIHAVNKANSTTRIRNEKGQYEAETNHGTIHSPVGRTRTRTVDKKEERGAPSQKKEAAPIDPAWQLTAEEMAEEKKRHPDLDVPREFERFKLYYQAKGNAERYWHPKFRFWLVDQDGFKAKDQADKEPPPAILTNEEKAAADQAAKDRRPQWEKDMEEWQNNKAP